MDSDDQFLLYLLTMFLGLIFVGVYAVVEAYMIPIFMIELGYGDVPELQITSQMTKELNLALWSNIGIYFVSVYLLIVATILIALSIHLKNE